ncbi:hypothetical protein COU78_06435 [Candidatus Peregrinibacteria bacterium CG10_big_fil_rev_8_21_14_0_10_49_24]|nr:MAG: hypothetical protein COV83_04850 [Candidatus Peregrinibacteria bacterium CG11_big_fil_rev_8_21_14_0_20_49_14]PIR50487.1 MAG: hypothetical protein COU78_06435 [Candidatus Peregrinibacteria bacterium CG10_big_fil_rev_8_21_14_0_10_49_24]PJA67705.1 MAG: hypothetical protein CO157_03275 [Candidatus Peregrinibacteria bacterium CG_4_9_14_3_um_filter_49_12]
MEFDSLSLDLLVWSTIIVLLELIMWRLFRRKVVKVCLPMGDDWSFCRSLTVAKLRIFTVLHTLFLLCVIFVFHSLLW